MRCFVHDFDALHIVAMVLRRGRNSKSHACTHCQLQMRLYATLTRRKGGHGSDPTRSRWSCATVTARLAPRDRSK